MSEVESHGIVVGGLIAHSSYSDAVLANQRLQEGRPYLKSYQKTYWHKENAPDEFRRYIDTLVDDCKGGIPSIVEKYGTNPASTIRTQLRELLR
jgi:hypothetical protein